MSKKSTLYIITKSVWGGAAKYVYDLAASLNKEEFNVSVAAGGQGKLAQRLFQANIPYFQINSFQRKVNVLKDFFAIWEIYRLLLKLKPDVIHINSSKAGGLAGTAGWFYSFLSNKKVRLIFTAHGWAFAEDRPKWQISLIKLFSKITALFYDKIICVSKYDRKIAITNKIAKTNKLITIYNGIDPKELSFFSRQKAQQKLLNKASPFVIGTIAEWTKNKGLIYLLKAASIIKPQDKFDVVLIGNGENPDKEKIYKFIKKHSLKSIHLHEYIPNAANYLRAFDIFVLPSVKEGLPYTILEAMTAETPIIATQVGGVSEMINDNQNGLLAPSKNGQILAKKIIYLLNNPKIGQKLTQNAKKQIEQKFNLEKMTKQTTNIY